MKYKRTTNCRFCNAPLTHTFVDLGITPLSNSYLLKEDLQKEEPVYPLHAKVCGNCFLVQIDYAVPPEEIFSHYSYFSSYSDSWLKHAAKFTEDAVARFNLSDKSKVIEVASNDGYLLRNFVRLNIPCLGVDPADNVAKVAIDAGIPTEIAFFGSQIAEKLSSCGNNADLMVANNVLAHTPNLNDFVAGFKILLKPEGVISIEIPHLLKLIKGIEFDTIYNEHFSYFSLYTLEKIFESHQLCIFDVEELRTHGGSLRIFVCHKESKRPSNTKNLEKVRKDESEDKLDRLEGYINFSEKVKKTCQDLIDFLEQEKKSGKTIAAYGAAAKGNTLLNTCKIGTDKISFVVDKSLAKQGHYLPGSRIPIYTPEKVFEEKPDYLLILPWNIAGEIREQMQGICEWGGKFVTAIPSIRVFD